MAYDKFRKKVALNIKNARKNAAVTQEGMAKNGFNIRHYQDIESGKVNITLETIYRLAHVFKTSPDKLIKVK
jgi:transcriptional regulator with XRE-family HTH domain